MPQTFGPYPAVVTDWHDESDTCHANLDLGFCDLPVRS